MIGSRHNPFVDLKPGTALDLPATNRLTGAGHLWSQPEIEALIFAWAARRPLLVRGEAGSGKSQIARAAARVLGGQEPTIEVIHPRFEALDLLYQVDAVERLADAQIHRLDRTNRKYVKRGALWRAFDGAGAGPCPPVLLIDEIDKADADVPNALLEVLGNRSFTVRPLRNKIIAASAGHLPLVIITTNEERELPPAFVRRCAVLNLNPPKDEKAFKAWLVDRGRVHRRLRIDDVARPLAAEQVLADRNTAARDGYAPVGLAEYIDLLTALDELTTMEEPEARAAEQRDWLQRLSAYALVKNANQDQARAPVQSRAEAEGSTDPPAGL